MLKVIKELLLKIIDSIDAGNSNITEKEAFEIIDIIKINIKRFQKIITFLLLI